MTSTTFVDLVGPPVNAAWLNDVNRKTYGPPQSSDSSLVGYLPAVGGAATTVETALREHVSANRYALTDPTGVVSSSTALQAALDAGGKVEIPAGTYKLTTTLLWDISKASLVALGNVIFSYTGQSGPAIQAFSSKSYPDNVTQNSTNYCQGIQFTGDNTASSVGVKVGHATYTNNDEVLFRNCTFVKFANILQFIDNAWRSRFDQCVFSKPTDGGKFIDYPITLTNSGEVMQFDHCFFADPLGSTTDTPLSLQRGQWVFNGCSIGGGGKVVIAGAGDATISLFGCNLERQSSVTTGRQINVSNLTQVNIIGGTLIQDAATPYTYAPIQIDGNASLNMVGVEINGPSANISWETTDTQRNLVTGTSSRINISGIMLDGAMNQTGFQFGISSAINCLVNGDGSFGSTGIPAAVTGGSFVRGQTYTITTLGSTDFTLCGAASNTLNAAFTATNIGAGTGTATPSPYGWVVAVGSASVQTGGRTGNCLQVNNAGASSLIYQVIPLAPNANGKNVLMNIWYKVAVANAATSTSPIVSFYADPALINQVGSNITQSFGTAATTGWTNLGSIWATIPAGARYCVVQLTAASGTTVQYDDVQAQII